MMTHESNFQHILYSVENGVASITFNRPEKLNTLGIGEGSSRDEIARALTQADADTNVGVVLISANGRAFCAGGDLTGIAPAETALDNHLFNEQILHFFGAFRSMHKPVIAAVNGLCLGAGMGLIAQCDLVIAGDDAQFGL